MTERRRERVFSGVLLAALLAGLAFDLRSMDVAPAGAGEGVSGGFRAHSVFCPGAVSEKGTDVDVAVSSASGDAVPVAVEPQENETVNVPEPGALIYDVGDARPAAVVGYGGATAVAVLTTTERPGKGAGAALCARRAASDWYFASGSASIHADQRILLLNPFPAEAVVRLSLFTPAGEETRASLSDVAVPARKFTVVALNEKILPEETLAVRVSAERGRVVAWRQLFVQGRDRVAGVQFSLGAPDLATVWYFPDGIVGDGTKERISILNPTEEEAVVAVSLALGPHEAVSPPGLMELAVPPLSQLVVPVEKHVRRDGEPVHVAATVRVLNGVEVVTERAVTYDIDEVTGMAAEVGATRAHRRWLLPPPAAAPGEDAIAILNPSTSRARVSVRLVRRGGGEVDVPELERMRIGPSGRVRVPVARWTGGQPVVALVEADVPVVAERFGTARVTGDPAALMGIPLP